MMQGQGRRWMWATMLPLLFGTAHAQGTAAARADASAPFAAAWTAMGTAARDWVMAVSPPVPAHWPPDADGALVRYAYAWTLRLHIADGSEVAAPWARSEGKPGEAPRVEVIRRTLESLGIQGVRPMLPAELQLAGREEEVAALLTSPLSPASEPLIRAYYCKWRSLNGVIAATLVPRHPEFFAWLRCR